MLIRKLITEVFIIKIFLLIHLAKSEEWDYEKKGPDAWPYIYESCNGKSQSPINVVTGNVDYNPNLKDIIFNNYDKRSLWNVTKLNDTTIAYKISDLNNPPAYVTGSDWNLPFELIQMHMHWGFNNFQGSEHQINDEKYPLELHLVHRSSIKTLAVLGFLFKISDSDNSNLDEFLGIVKNLKTINSFNLTSVSLTSLLPDLKTLNSNGYYRYSGSLTTPPCSEGVIWTLFDTKVNISAKQMEILRENTIEFNYRLPQKLNGRIVYKNIPTSGNSQYIDFLIDFWNWLKGKF